MQDNELISSAVVNIAGPPKINFMNDELCAATGADEFMRLGGMTGMGEAMSRGMVLVMSIWWDQGGNMNWLDQGNSGPCNATEGNPTSIVKVEPNPEVTFSNIRIGEINSTFSLRTPYQRGSFSGSVRREAQLESHLHQHRHHHGF